MTGRHFIYGPDTTTSPDRFLDVMHAMIADVRRCTGLNLSLSLRDGLQGYPIPQGNRP
jgi:hypothetical protein